MDLRSSPAKYRLGFDRDSSSDVLVLAGGTPPPSVPWLQSQAGRCRRHILGADMFPDRLGDLAPKCVQRNTRKRGDGAAFPQRRGAGEPGERGRRQLGSCAPRHNQVAIHPSTQELEEITRQPVKPEVVFQAPGRLAEELGGNQLDH